MGELANLGGTAIKQFGIFSIMLFLSFLSVAIIVVDPFLGGIIATSMLIITTWVGWRTLVTISDARSKYDAAQ